MTQRATERGRKTLKNTIKTNMCVVTDKTPIEVTNNYQVESSNEWVKSEKKDY
jgi:hypothetical protein